MPLLSAGKVYNGSNVIFINTNHIELENVQMKARTGKFAAYLQFTDVPQAIQDIGDACLSELATRYPGQTFSIMYNVIPECGNAKLCSHCDKKIGCFFKAVNNEFVKRNDEGVPEGVNWSKVRQHPWFNEKRTLNVSGKVTASRLTFKEKEPDIVNIKLYVPDILFYTCMTEAIDLLADIGEPSKKRKRIEKKRISESEAESDDGLAAKDFD